VHQRADTLPDAFGWLFLLVLERGKKKWKIGGGGERLIWQDDLYSVMKIEQAELLSGST
jgi:hypothetical protein